LPQVTLVAVSSVAIAATERALVQCMEQIDFARVLFCTDASPHPGRINGIDYLPINRLGSRQDYSRFMLKELAIHIDTEFALCVQWDGYVLNAANWSGAFLDYDYIGAVWPQFGEGRNVGNGGFSLRSRKLLDACRDERISGRHAEDVEICVISREFLEKDHGIRFAPPELASRFSYERLRPDGEEFGFHGVFNLPDLLGTGDFRDFYGSIDEGLIGRHETNDLIRWAFRHLSFGLLYNIARRRLSALPSIREKLLFLRDCLLQLTSRHGLARPASAPTDEERQW
jgi:hypothetical protein